MKVKLLIVLFLAAILVGIYSFFPQGTPKAPLVAATQPKPTAPPAPEKVADTAGSLREKNEPIPAGQILEEEIKPLASLDRPRPATPAPQEPQAHETSAPAPSDQTTTPPAPASQITAPIAETDPKAAEETASVEPKPAPAQAAATPVKTAAAEPRAPQPVPEFFQQRPDENQIREMQTHLAALNYPVGPIDGILGPRTYRAVTEFQSDLGFADIISVPNLIILLDTYQKVGIEYPTWKRVYRSRKFKAWIASKGHNVSREYINTIRSGPERKIIDIINEYFTET